MKKTKYYLLGTLFIVLAVVFIVVPGPSILFLLAALVCFSMINENAKQYLRKAQKAFKSASIKLDRRFK
ncbi:YbaN family protein (plasmid) [Pseudoalteromonas xiamenensis]|uniref:PGPGW domain-containing protein n=1 Tax=Pseudoalteromonas xiamenensis TaxID=882626 RepID=UPI0027E55E04|nr:PGPGW domain-containing protein [Pseudoalteromonas xiamenensis]WMN62073.1 YbaN family protein [Pseudoalteromonas xiamenensis]